MDQKPKIPTLKDSQKPQVRIKGLAARLSLVERIKQFKKKDLAFILAGLGVLFMAPLAEHFMMSPENAGDGAFKPGWGFQAEKGFGGGGSPFEPGVNGMAPGGYAGSGGDVITPLNVRDPSALVMGPGASQQPAATAAAAAPAAKENTDWKDAINAANKGAAAATKAASLPVPKAALTNAGLRGLSASSGGGGGATWSAPPINSRAPTAAHQDSMGYVSKNPDYRGVGTRGSTDGSASSLAALKKAAENAGSALNRQGSAANAAEQAAGMNMPTGSGGGIGEGGSGKDDKGGSGNAGKDSKSLGESLAFLAAKENQQKAIDLYWKLKEKEAMLWPDLKQKLLEEAVMTPFKALTAGIADAIKDFGNPAAAGFTCNGQNYPASAKCAATNDPKTGSSNGQCIKLYNGNWYLVSSPSANIDANTQTCKVKGGVDETPAAKAETTPQGANVAGAKPDYGSAGGTSLDNVCDPTFLGATGDTAKMSKEVAQSLGSANMTLGGSSNGANCGGTSFLASGDVTQTAKSIKELSADAKRQLDTVKTNMAGAAGALGKAGKDAAAALSGAEVPTEVNRLFDDAKKTPANDVKDRKEAEALADLQSSAASAKAYVNFQKKTDWQTAEENLKKTSDPLNKAKLDLDAIGKGLTAVDGALTTTGGKLKKDLPALIAGDTNIDPGAGRTKANALVTKLQGIQSKQEQALATANGEYTTLQAGLANAKRLLNDPAGPAGVNDPKAPAGTLASLHKYTGFVVNGGDPPTPAQQEYASVTMSFPKLQEQVKALNITVPATDISATGPVRSQYQTLDASLRTSFQPLASQQPIVSQAVTDMYGKAGQPAAKPEKPAKK